MFNKYIFKKKWGDHFLHTPSYSLEAALARPPPRLLRTRERDPRSHERASTCFIWGGEPEALGRHAAPSGAERASGLLLSERRAGEAAERLGPAVSEQVRGIWR